jgi:hypothetical protein
MYHLLNSFSEINTRIREAKSGLLNFTLGWNKIFAFTVLIGAEFTVVWASNLMEKKQCLTLQCLSLTNYCSQKILGVFAEIAKASNNFVMFACRSARPSVCPHGTTWLPPNGFSWNLISEHFSKICPENSKFINIWQE